MARLVKFAIILSIFITLASFYYVFGTSDEKAATVSIHADKEINLLPNWGINNFAIDKDDNIRFPGFNMTDFTGDYYKKSNDQRKNAMYVSRYDINSKKLTSFELEGERGMAEFFNGGEE